MKKRSKDIETSEYMTIARIHRGFLVTWRCWGEPEEQAVTTTFDELKEFVRKFSLAGPLKETKPGGEMEATDD